MKKEEKQEIIDQENKRDKKVKDIIRKGINKYYYWQISGFYKNVSLFLIDTTKETTFDSASKRI